MHKILVFTLLSFFFSISLAAQCSLEAAATDFTCNLDSGTFSFRLTITGSDSTVRFPEIGLEFPLPLDEYFQIPIDNIDSLVLNLESGTAGDLCQETIVIVRPADCSPGGSSDCPVSIIRGDELCGTPTTLSAESGGTPPFIYQWNTGDSTAVIDFAGAHFEYAVTVTDADGCVGSDHRFFWSSSPFSIHVESSGDPCLGETPTLTASVFHGQGPYRYLWSTGDSTSSITDITPEEHYFVTVTDANGCSSEAQGFYHPGGAFRQLHISGPTITNCDGSPITLTVEDPDPNVIYTWVNGTDTLTGEQIRTTLSGSFLVSGTSIDNPACQFFGWFEVRSGSFTPDQLAIVTIAESCDSFICLAVINTETGAFIWDETTVEWSSPNADNFEQDFGIICITESGTYKATVTTACDTTVLVTIIKSLDACTDFCGTIMMDDNADCTTDDGSWDMSSTTLLITNDSTNISYMVHPNPNGSFCGTAPIGSYTLKTIGNNLDISTSCTLQSPSMELSPNSFENMELFARSPSEEEASDQSTSLFNRPNRGTSQQLSVFPNPSTGLLRVDLVDEIIAPTDVLFLYDMTGRQQDQITGARLGEFWQPQNTISGVYHLVLTDANGRLKARSSVVFQ